MILSKNFVRFLKEYRVVAISVAFIISLAALSFIQSIVNDVILPIFRALFARDTLIWEDMILPIGSVNIRIGSFLSAFLSLLLTVILLYIVIDRIIKWKPKR
ncbi:MAG: MscL family protein [archaeon]